MNARTILVVFDALRPDFITPELMPHLWALRQRGILATTHHAAFPSKTRVQSATIATGCYPGRHGLVDNELHIPALETNPVNTGAVDNLRAIDRATDGQLLTAPSLGERLVDAGLDFYAGGSCSTGANFLCNHTEAGRGIYNARGLISPADQHDAVIETIGACPEIDQPNAAQNRWAVDAMLEFAVRKSDRPAVSVVWLSDPDKTMHAYGVGHEQVLRALQLADAELGRISTELEDRDLADETDLVVIGDHGFSTDVGDLDVQHRLMEAGLATDVSVAGHHVYVPAADDQLRQHVVDVLRTDDRIGAVLTKNGTVPGTFPLAAVGLDHHRSGDVVWAPAWSDEGNAYGYPGTTTRAGVGSHGTLSPYEMCVNLIAAGPSFKAGGLESAVPTGHVDIVPTILDIHDMRPPASLDGRILTEMRAGGPDPASVSWGTERLAPAAPTDETCILERATVGTSWYPQAIQCTEKN